MEEVKEKLFKLIAETLQIPLEQVDEELEIGSIPEWDSMAHLHLISAIEEAFEMQIDVSKLVDAEEVCDLLDIVKKR